MRKGEWKRITWRNLWQQVQTVGAALLEMGLGQGQPAGRAVAQLARAARAAAGGRVRRRAGGAGVAGLFAAEPRLRAPQGRVRAGAACGALRAGRRHLRPRCRCGRRPGRAGDRRAWRAPTAALSWQTLAERRTHAAAPRPGRRRARGHPASTTSPRSSSPPARPACPRACRSATATCKPPRRTCRTCSPASPRTTSRPSSSTGCRGTTRWAACSTWAARCCWAPPTTSTTASRCPACSSARCATCARSRRRC